MDSSFWLSRWRENRIGFHREAVNEHVLRWWPSLNAQPAARVVVPLCGKSYDLDWLAERHVTVGVELSPIALDDVWQRCPREPSRHRQGTHFWSSDGQLTTICGDFMALTTEQIAPFDHFYDRAALIALPARLREQYVKTIKGLSTERASGLLVALEYDQEKMDGPPFSISVDAVRSLFSPDFKVDVLMSQSSSQVPERFQSLGITTLTEHILKLSRD
tara:strand:- start:275 stop:928 length:654 start_codon:yes stop_codon:yes gene_type:complete